MNNKIVIVSLVCFMALSLILTNTPIPQVALGFFYLIQSIDTQTNVLFYQFAEKEIAPDSIGLTTNSHMGFNYN